MRKGHQRRTCEPDPEGVWGLAPMVEVPRATSPAYVPRGYLARRKLPLGAVLDLLRRIRNVERDERPDAGALFTLRRATLAP